MADLNGTEVVKVGLSGGLLWPSFLHPGLSKAVPVCSRNSIDPELESKQPAQRLCYSWVPSSSPTHLPWVPPSQLTKPFKQYKAVEEGLKHYNSNFQDAPVPRALLREQLDEALASPQLLSETELQGNRLCTIESADGSILLGHPSGPTGDVPTLTVLQRQPEGALLCTQVCYGPGNGHAILQAAFSHGQPGSKGALLLATRSDYWMTVYRLLSIQAASDDDSDATAAQPMRWALHQVGSLQTQARIVHMSWNRALRAELAFMCEDGAVGVVDALGGGPGSKGDLRPCMVKGPLQMGRSPGRAMLEWGRHPRLLYCILGCKLLCLDMRAGATEAAISVLHARPEDESLVALACGSGPHGRNLVALASLRHVLLLNVRRPSNPLLMWEHGMHREAPQLLSIAIQQHVGPGTSAGDNPSPAPEKAEAILGSPASPPQPSQGLEDGGDFGQQAAEAHDDGGGFPQQLTPNLVATQASQMDMWGPSQPVPAQGAAAKRGGKAAVEPPQLRGCITAANLSLGEVLSFRFSIAEPSTRLEAHAPTSRPHANGEGDLGRILMRRCHGAGSAASGHPRPAIDQSAEGQRGFSWVPYASCTARSEELPQRVALPLKERRDWEERSFLMLYDRDLAKDDIDTLWWAPDLQGIAFLPLPAATGSPKLAASLDISGTPGLAPPPADSLLLRLDFMGDLYIDTCMLQKAGPSFRLAAEVQPQRTALSPLRSKPHPSLLPEAVLQQSEGWPERQSPKKANRKQPTLCSADKHAVQDLLSKTGDEWLQASDPGEGQQRLFSEFSVAARDESLRALKDGARLPEPPTEESPPRVSLEEDVQLQRVLEELQVPLTVAEIFEELQNLRLEEKDGGSESDRHVAVRPGLRFGRVPSQGPKPIFRTGPRDVDAAAQRAQRELAEMENGRMALPIALTHLHRHIASHSARNISISTGRVVPVQGPEQPDREPESQPHASQDPSAAGPSQQLSQDLPWMWDSQASVGEASRGAPGAPADEVRPGSLDPYTLVPCDSFLGYGTVVHRTMPDRSVFGEAIRNAPSVPALSIKPLPEQMSNTAEESLRRLEQKWLETELIASNAACLVVPRASSVQIGQATGSQSASQIASQLPSQPGWGSSQPSQNFLGLARGSQEMVAFGACQEGVLLSQQQPGSMASPPPRTTTKSKKRRIVQEGFS